MLGHHTRSPRTDSAAFASRFADALAGTGRDERIGVVTALAATGSLAPAVLDVMLVTVLDHAEGLPIPFDGHRGWNWGNDLDLRDAHAVVLDAIDRSGCASDVLATRESHATRLLDPDRRYSEAAEAALDRVLDRPRLNLLDGDPADDATATRAIRHLVAATRELDGTVHPAGAAALARITISFPADVTDGFGLGYQAAVDFVAAARSDDRPVLLADHGEWSGAIDAALNEYAASQFDIALRSAAGGDIDLRAAQRAGEAEMLSVVSRVHREALDGAATDEHNAAVRMVGGWIVDVVAVPIKNPLTAVAATQVADWVVGQVWPGGHLDGAKEDLAPAVAVTAAVGAARAVGFAIETGALPSASLPPGVRPVQLLASESGVRTLSKLSAQLPPALVEACEQRMKPASAALVGLNVGHR